MGWYHSHPFFPVEPSLIDVRNHNLHQQRFENEGLPYLAAIIGPYTQKSKTESLLKIFHLVGGGPKSAQSKEPPLPKPFELPYKMLPCTKLRKSFFEVEIKNLIGYYRGHKDLINLKVRWGGGTANSTASTQAKTREDKLLEAVQLILQRNRDSAADRQRILRDMVDSLTDQDRDTYFARSIPKSLVNDLGEIPTDTELLTTHSCDFQIHFRDQPETGLP